MNNNMVMKHLELRFLKVFKGSIHIPESIDLSYYTYMSDFNRIECDGRQISLTPRYSQFKVRSSDISLVLNLKFVTGLIYYYTA
jgi:hypothetical protein